MNHLEAIETALTPLGGSVSNALIKNAVDYHENGFCVSGIVRWFNLKPETDSIEFVVHDWIWWKDTNMAWLESGNYFRDFDAHEKSYANFMERAGLSFFCDLINQEKPPI